MEILKGLLYINGFDVYETYGAYLAEEEEGEFENYSALLKIGRAKSRISVDFPEDDGKKYPRKIVTRLEERSVTLRFAIEGDDAADFLDRYSRFVAMLCTGDDDGWLTLRLTELDKDFRFCYSDCDEWKQLTRLDGKVYATFRITFTEPNPDYNYSSNNG